MVWFLVHYRFRRWNKKKRNCAYMWMCECVYFYTNCVCVMEKVNEHTVKSKNGFAGKERKRENSIKNGIEEKWYALAHNTPKYEIIKWRMTQTRTYCIHAHTHTQHNYTGRMVELYEFDPQEWEQRSERQTDQLVFHSFICMRTRLLCFQTTKANTSVQTMYKHRISLMSKITNTHTHAHIEMPNGTQERDIAMISKTVHCTQTHWCNERAYIYHGHNYYVWCEQYFASAMQNSTHACTHAYAYICVKRSYTIHSFAQLHTIQVYRIIERDGQKCVSVCIDTQT